jgi:hypothetical protein
MIFNSFIGMILAGTILQVLLKSGIDVAVIFFVTIFLGKYLPLQSRAKIQN